MVWFLLLCSLEKLKDYHVPFPETCAVVFTTTDYPDCLDTATYLGVVFRPRRFPSRETLLPVCALGSAYARMVERPYR